jgi:hypothetical protein
MMASFGRVKLASISSDDRIAQAPNPLDFHFNHVARSFGALRSMITINASILPLGR